MCYDAMMLLCLVVEGGMKTIRQIANNICPPSCPVGVGEYRRPGGNSFARSKEAQYHMMKMRGMKYG